MKVSNIREIIRHLPGRTELMFIPESEIETGQVLKPGLAYYDIETEELVYIGEIKIIQNIDED
jgi:hypothetical protein